MHTAHQDHDQQVWAPAWAGGVQSGTWPLTGCAISCQATLDGVVQGASARGQGKGHANRLILFELLHCEAHQEGLF
eukprot:1791924-Amphidinium_carterae.1